MMDKLKDCSSLSELKIGVNGTRGQTSLLSSVGV